MNETDGTEIGTPTQPELVELRAAPVDRGRRIPVFLGLCLYASVAAAAVIWIHRDGRTSVRELYAGGSIPLAIAVGLGTGVTLAGLCVGLSMAARPYRDLEFEFAKMTADQRRWEIVILATLAGAAEELFFRGAMQAHLGIAVTSLIFGLVHFPLTFRMTLWPFLAAVCGAIFALELVTLHNILAPSIAHAIVTGTALWRIAGRYGGRKLADA